MLDRQVISLLTTQAGVSDGRGATVINGMRTSYATVTMDGINIQDNFIRSNALSFIPNRITVDQVSRSDDFDIELELDARRRSGSG